MTLIAVCEGLLFTHSLTFFFLYTRFYNLDLLTYQILETTLAIIVCLNPLFGYLSDRFEICGSKRRSYVLIMSFIGTVCYALCASTFYWNIPVAVIFVMHFLIDASNTFRNVIVDSICVINHNIAKFKIKNKESSSNSSVSVLFVCRLIGRIVSISLLGTIYNYLECRCDLISFLHSRKCHVHFRCNRLLFERTEDRRSADQLRQQSLAKTLQFVFLRSKGKTLSDCSSPTAL